MTRASIVALLLLCGAIATRGEEARERASRLAEEAVDRGLTRARRAVRNALEEELDLPRTALEESEEWFRAGRDEWLRKFAAITRKAVKRRDTDAAVFHGCCDWHSAVHGYWALLRAMRATRDRADEEWIRASLKPEGLARESAFLRENPRFEMPYGRAWFLRMAMEYEDVLHDKTVHEMASLVAESLWVALGSRPRTPARGEYGNDSWAIAQLHAWYARHDPPRAAQVVAWVRDEFLRAESRLSSDSDFRRPAFFSLWGNWAYLIAHTMSEEDLRAWYRLHPLGDPDPVWRTLNPHHLGMVWSRAWAIGTLARRLNDPSLRWSYLRHVEEGLRQRDLHAGNYLEYDHWVPQFAVYALTIELDEEGPR